MDKQLVLYYIIHRETPQKGHQYRIWGTDEQSPNMGSRDPKYYWGSEGEPFKTRKEAQTQLDIYHPKVQ
jgi:hypothetical protein